MAQLRGGLLRRIDVLTRLFPGQPDDFFFEYGSDVGHVVSYSLTLLAKNREFSHCVFASQEHNFAEGLSKNRVSRGMRPT